MSQDLSAPIVWLEAKGSFDTYLTAVPEKTYFKRIYSRHTNFSWADVELLSVTPPTYGGDLRFMIPKIGDLVTQMYLYYNIGKLNYGTANISVNRPALNANLTVNANLPTVATDVVAAFEADKLPLVADGEYDGLTHEDLNAAWIDHLGYVLTNTVELWIGGQKIESHTGDFLHVWDSLTASREHSSISNLPKEHGGVGNVGTQHDQHIYVPLQFFFNRNPGHALPIAALQYHDVEVRVKLSQKPLRADYTRYFEKVPFGKEVTVADKLRYTPQDVQVYIETETLDSNQKPINAFTYASTNEYLKNKALGGEILKAALVTRFVFLDKFERQQFVSGKHSYLITETQHMSFPLKSEDKLIKEYLLDDFTGACKELIFFFRADHKRLEGSGDKNSNWDFWNFEGNRPFDANEMKLAPSGEYYLPTFGKQMAHIDNTFFDRATFAINGKELWAPPRDPLWFSHYLPSEFHSKVPVENNFEMIYVMPFAVFPESDDPSGSINLSKIDRPVLHFRFKQVPGLKEGAVMTDGHVEVYARTLNLVEIAEGHGRKVFLT